MNQLPLHNQAFTISFANQQIARAVRVHRNVDIALVTHLLGFTEFYPVIFISGGASGMSEADQQHTKTIIDGIAQFAEERKAIIIDGGTESGIMKMIGDTRGTLHYHFPLVGVSPLGRISYPGYTNPRQEAFLEDSHSHFVLVDGEEWGSESEMILRLTRALSGSGTKPAAGVLINGGKIALREIYLASTKRQKLPIIVLEGSGRAADEISTGYRTGQTERTIVQVILSGGDIQLVGTTEGPEVMRQCLIEKFATKTKE